MDPQSIKSETKGDFSPGVVFGDYNLQLTPEFVEAWHNSRRRNWRPLEKVNVVWPGTIQGVVQFFHICSILAAEKLGGNERFLHTTLLFSFNPAYSPPDSNLDPSPLLKIVGNQPVYFQRLRKEMRGFLENYSRLKKRGNVEEITAGREKLAADYDRIKQEWHFELDERVFDGTIHAVEFSCDLDARRLVFHVKDYYPIDLAEYSTRIATTSEALHLIASILRPEREIRIFGNIDLALKNVSVQKLFCYMMDKTTFELEPMRFEATDRESWDFEYLEFDRQVEIAEARIKANKSNTAQPPTR